MTGENEHSIPSVQKTNKSDFHKVDSDPIPPFPLFKSLILATVLVNESLCANMLLPFIGLFVAHLQGKTAEEAGFASGFLVAVFQLGQVFSGKKWGRLSDKFGRKPAMQLGLVFSGFIMFLFGFCPNIYVGILLRLIHGLVNGNILVAKAMLPEVMGHKAHEPKGYAIPSMTWGLGTLIGPAIGGAFYDPTRYSWFPFGPESIFGNYPALLPSLVIGSYSFFALGVCTLFLPETNVNAKRLGFGKNSNKANKLSKSEAPKDTKDNIQSQPKTKFGYKQAFQNPLTCTVLALYMIISFSDIAFYEILPLWAVSGRAFGGLSMPSQTVGFVILINGLPGMFANFVFSRMLNKIGGPTSLLKLGVTLWLLSAFVQPFSHHLEGGMCLAVVSFLLIVRVIGSAWTFSTTFLLIGRTAPQGHLGSINGIAQSLGCATRTLAPLLVAPLYAWSISSPHPFPFNYHLAFIVGWVPILATYKLASFIAMDPLVLGLPPATNLLGAAALDIEHPRSDGEDDGEQDDRYSIIIGSGCLLRMQFEDLQRVSTKAASEEFAIVSATASKQPSPAAGPIRRSKAPTPMLSPFVQVQGPLKNNSLCGRAVDNDSIASKRSLNLRSQASSARGPLASPYPRRMIVVGASPSIAPNMILIESETEQHGLEVHELPPKLSI